MSLLTSERVLPFWTDVGTTEKELFPIETRSRSLFTAGFASRSISVRDGRMCQQKFSSNSNFRIGECKHVQSSGLIAVAPFASKDEIHCDRNPLSH